MIHKGFYLTPTGNKLTSDFTKFLINDWSLIPVDVENEVMFRLFRWPRLLSPATVKEAAAIESLLCWFNNIWIAKAQY